MGARGVSVVEMDEPTMPELKILPDTRSVAHVAADAIVSAAESAIAARGHFTIALSGGNTPENLYRLLATEQYRAQIDWANTYIFWGDERCVPPDHRDSSYRMAREALLDHVPLPAGNIFRMRGEDEPHSAAEAYEQGLRDFFTRREADVLVQPRFDLILLGMGDDGHTASLFPNTDAVDERSRWVIAHYVPRVEMWRISLTAPAINAARQIMFLVTGAGKADTLREVLTGPHRPRQLPAQLVQPVDGRLIWLVDQAAAARLPDGMQRAADA